MVQLAISSQLSKLRKKEILGNCRGWLRRKQNCRQKNLHKALMNNSVVVLYFQELIRSTYPFITEVIQRYFCTPNFYRP